MAAARAVSVEEDFQDPPECSDSLCSGHIDERNGCCVLCGERGDLKPCAECEGLSMHANGCSSLEMDPMDYGTDGDL